MLNDVLVSIPLSSPSAQMLYAGIMTVLNELQDLEIAELSGLTALLL